MKALCIFEIQGSENLSLFATKRKENKGECSCSRGMNRIPRCLNGSEVQSVLSSYLVVFSGEFEVPDTFLLVFDSLLVTSV